MKGAAAGKREECAVKLETERLVLRPITQDDFDSWQEILSDAETMKHYPAPYDAAGVQRWVD